MTTHGRPERPEGLREAARLARLARLAAQSERPERPVPLGMKRCTWCAYDFPEGEYDVPKDGYYVCKECFNASLANEEFLSL